MTKRLLASLMSVLMIMTVFVAVPVSAEVTLPANIHDDYVPNEETKFSNNMIPGDGSNAGNVINSTYVYNGYAPSWWHSAGNTSDAIYVNLNAAYGSIINTNDIVVGHKITPTVTDASQTGNVLFSFSIKSGRGTPYVNIGRLNSETGTVEYPVEHGVEGVAPGTSYEIFKGTFADTGSTADKYTKYAIGFVDPTTTNTQYWFKTADAYIGYEYAYDMTLTPDITEVQPNGKITIEAEVVNQLGDDFGGDTGIDWYATTADRNVAVDGFTFTDNEDGTYTVKVAKTVEEGTYDLVAVSQADSDIVKGIEIEVDIDYSDYVAGDVEGNMIKETETWGYNYCDHWGGGHDVSVSAVSDEAGCVYIKALREVVHPNLAGPSFAGWTGVEKYWQGSPFAGINIDVALPQADRTGDIVFSFDVKNANSNYQPIVNVGRRYKTVGEDPSAPEYPAEEAYNAANKGFAPVAGEGYQKFTGTFVNNPERSEVDYADTFAIGLAEGTEKDAVVYINTTTAYIGYEYAYDIDVEADATELAYVGDEININYNIVNQLEEKGSIDQTVSFKVFAGEDENRETPLADTGITVTDNGDGTAVVTFDPYTTAAGEYDIVAYSAEYGMAKGVTVTVAENKAVGTLALSAITEGTVEVTATLKNITDTPVNAVLVVIMVNDNNKIEDISITPISNLTSSDGLKTYTPELTATDAAKVTKAKAFLLDCGENAEPTLYNSTLNELARSVVTE